LGLADRIARRCPWQTAVIAPAAPLAEVITRDGVTGADGGVAPPPGRAGRSGRADDGVGFWVGVEPGVVLEGLVTVALDGLDGLPVAG
jgi:hypothetical protein